jgi:cytochrome c biogenesis protein CcmG/thiol:disulfide interchange protein DsbE
MRETSSGPQVATKPVEHEGSRRRLRAAALPFLVFAALAALFAFALRSGDPSKLPSTMIGKPAPVTAFPPVEGLAEAGRPVPGFKSTDLAAGKVTVVNFWASWCIPCVQEHPLLGEIVRRTGADVVGVNYKDEPANARRFLGRYGNPFKAVGTDLNGRQAIEWGVYGMPESFVVNGRGEITYKHVGPISPESLEQRVLPAIEAAKRASATAQAR